MENNSMMTEEQMELTAEAKKAETGNFSETASDKATSDMTEQAEKPVRRRARKKAVETDSETKTSKSVRKRTVKAEETDSSEAAVKKPTRKSAVKAEETDSSEAASQKPTRKRTVKAEETDGSEAAVKKNTRKKSVKTEAAEAAPSAARRGRKKAETAESQTPVTKTVRKSRSNAAKAAKKEEPVTPFITEMDQYLFGMGTHYEIYRKLGAHPAEKDGVKGVYFAVWAPNVEYAAVVGDFNGWDRGAVPMTRLEPMGIWEAWVPGLEAGVIYKYYFYTKNGWDLEKADPFASSAELRPGTASKVADTEHFKWSDSSWLKKRETFDVDTCPMSVYEVHPGSWKCHPVDGEVQKDADRFYNYREFAHELVNYVKDMGYTHVELIGISEHPLDASWGYQVTGYFAPTSRYGTPEDFMYFVDYLHKNRIGVILDWVPAHFPKDGCGLSEFDGTCLFEHENPLLGEHPQWGTRIFNYGRSEVKNFLIASALNWIEHYHVDGLRVDAVASMLYLDFGREDGQWIPNEYGGRENLQAIEFLKHMNSIVRDRNQGVLMIAEESTAWPKVTESPENDGLGFSLKWNMGWMNDFLEYQKLDPVYRKYHHNKMTFSMVYAFSEKFMLVLSHDEVVHLKKSMLSKMPGAWYEQFDNLKAAYAYMIGHPGKKLLFMGQDFGQWNEWNENQELDWYLLGEEKHQQLQNFVRALLQLYGKNPALFDQDGSWEGFEWINADDAERSIFSFVRHSKDRKKNLVFVCNFTPVDRPDYRFGMDEKKRLKLVLDSDEAQFGGKEVKHARTFTPKAGECDGKPYYVEYPLSGYGVAVFQY